MQNGVEMNEEFDEHEAEEAAVAAKTATTSLRQKKQQRRATVVSISNPTADAENLSEQKPNELRYLHLRRSKLERSASLTATGNKAVKPKKLKKEQQQVKLVVPEEEEEKVQNEQKEQKEPEAKPPIAHFQPQRSVSYYVQGSYDMTGNYGDDTDNDGQLFQSPPVKTRSVTTHEYQTFPSPVLGGHSATTTDVKASKRSFFQDIRQGKNRFVQRVLVAMHLSSSDSEDNSFFKQKKTEYVQLLKRLRVVRKQIETMTHQCFGK